MVINVLKGKMKNEKRYISIMFVPLYSSKVRTFKISSFYLKLSVILIVLTLSLSTLAVYVKNTVEENKRLKEDIAFLYRLNFEQNDLLVRQNEILRINNDTIETLNREIDVRDAYINDRINEMLRKYKDLTDTYILNRINASTVSRSGDRMQFSSISDEIRELKSILEDLNDLNRFRSLQSIDVTESKKMINDYLATLPTFWPAAGSISSEFGNRKDPFTGIKKFHEGLDIAGNYGDDIYAAGDGTVTFSGYYGGYGRTVIIDHGRGITTLYGHASSLLVKEGDVVKKGDLIAKIGSSGRSTGAHLHFEVMINGNKVDPLEFLNSND